MKQNNYDVVILGGGIIGLCSAYFLSKNGISSVILEKGTIGHGSSLRNAGYISPSHFVPLAAPGVFKQGLKWMFNKKSPLYIKPRLDPKFLSWSWKFAQACNKSVTLNAIPTLRDLLEESKNLTILLSKELEIDFQLAKQGIGILFNTPKGRLACEHEAELAHEFGIVSKLLNQDELSELDKNVQFKAHGGLFFPEDMHLRPEKLLESLHSYLLKHNVTIVENCSVESFEVANHNILKVNTATSGSFSGKNYVLACGAYSDLLARKLKVKIPLQPGKGYSVTIQNPAVNPIHPYIFQEKRVAVTPFANALRFAGTMEFSGISQDINWPRVEAILDSLSGYFENIKRPAVAKDHLVWSGMRPVTPDGLPYIGRFQQIPNLIAATGHAMVGISLAPVTGSLVCDIVKEIQPQINLTLVNPNRYN